MTQQQLREQLDVERMVGITEAARGAGGKRDWRTQKMRAKYRGFTEELVEASGIENHECM